MSAREALAADAAAQANGSHLAQRLAPLFAAAPDADRPWLRKLLLSPGALRACSSIETEMYMLDEQARGAVLFSSVARREGRSTFAMLYAALSCALDARRRVLLVDADLDHGRLGALLGVPAGSDGLAQAFASAPHAGCIHPTALPNLWVAPRSGGSDPVTLAPAAFAAFMDEARTRFDLVVVDSPAGGVNNAALAIAKAVRNTIVVVRYGGPTREQVASFLAGLERAGAQVIGSVLNEREYVVPASFYGVD
jgi:Mrp family chromosome partitioning ATPase